MTKRKGGLLIVDVTYNGEVYFYDQSRGIDDAFTFTVEQARSFAESLLKQANLAEKISKSLKL